MKESYETPELKITVIDPDDIIIASGNGNEQEPFQ